MGASHHDSHFHQVAAMYLPMHIRHLQIILTLLQINITKAGADQRNEGHIVFIGVCIRHIVQYAAYKVIQETGTFPIALKILN